MAATSVKRRISNEPLSKITFTKWLNSCEMPDSGSDPYAFCGSEQPTVTTVGSGPTRIPAPVYVCQNDYQIQTAPADPSLPKTGFVRLAPVAQGVSSNSTGHQRFVRLVHLDPALLLSTVASVLPKQQVSKITIGSSTNGTRIKPIPAARTQQQPQHSIMKRTDIAAKVAPSGSNAVTSAATAAILSPTSRLVEMTIPVSVQSSLKLEKDAKTEMARQMASRSTISDQESQQSSDTKVHIGSDVRYGMLKRFRKTWNECGSSLKTIPPLRDKPLEYLKPGVTPEMRQRHIQKMRQRLSESYRNLVDRERAFNKTASIRNRLVSDLKTALRVDQANVSRILRNKPIVWTEGMKNPLRSCLMCCSPEIPFSGCCSRHILRNTQQKLFEKCNARFVNGRVCEAPAISITRDGVALCAEHSSKAEGAEARRKATVKRSASTAAAAQNTANIISGSVSAPKQTKRSTAPAASTVTRTSRKTKSRPTSAKTVAASLASLVSSSELATSGSAASISGVGPIAATASLQTPMQTALIQGASLDSISVDNNAAQTSEQSLSGFEMPIDTAEVVHQATKLLEEHDFTEVLNKISVDAFSELFTESRNGEYAPTAEETAELERALAEVNNDLMVHESLANLSAGGEEEFLPSLINDDSLRPPTASSDETSGASGPSAHGQPVQPYADLTSLSQALSNMAAQGNSKVHTVSMLSTALERAQQRRTSTESTTYFDHTTLKPPGDVPWMATPVCEYTPLIPKVKSPTNVNQAPPPSYTTAMRMRQQLLSQEEVGTLLF